MSRRPLLIAALLLALAGCRAADTGPAPHQIHIAGSSAGFPFSTMATEQLMRADVEAIAPLVRAGGSGDGITRFCDGPGRRHPDVLIVTRVMSPAEARRCATNGVTHVATIPMGFTALVLVKQKGDPAQPLTRAQLAQALTSGARDWSAIDPRLPARAIRIEGPTPDPAIADMLFGPVLSPGAHVRADGVYTGHGANADLIATRVALTPGAIGILPYSQAMTHADTLSILPLDGVAPTPKTIAAGRYPASAPLMLMVKADEVATTPALPRLLGYYAAGLAPDGGFVTRGLVPLPDTARAAALRRLAALDGR